MTNVFKNIFKRPILLFTIFWLLLTHGGATFLQDETINPQRYRMNAVDLTVTAQWRHGYEHGQHGCHLVKTRNIPEAVPLSDGESESTDKELKKVMSRELRIYPVKAVLELLFMAFIVVYIFFFVPWLKGRLMSDSSRCYTIILFTFGVWTAGWTLMCLPILCLGYGSSVFTTLVGPGAISFSGPYPGLITGLGAETITYRPLLEMFSSIPVMTVASSGIGYCLPRMSVGPSIWLSGVLFYGIISALLRGTGCLIKIIWDKRSN